MRNSELIDKTIIYEFMRENISQGTPATPTVL